MIVNTYGRVYLTTENIITHVQGSNARQIGIILSWTQEQQTVCVFIISQSPNLSVLKEEYI